MVYIAEKAIEFVDSAKATGTSSRQLRYSDADSVSAWAVDSIAQSVDQGLIQGVNGDLLAPKQKASRAEAAAVIRRVLKFLKFIN
ncbi:Endo-1,4-beta-xylanase A precursor [compost metagenome]